MLGDARRSRRVVQLAGGWARQLGNTISQLGAGQAGASKAAYRLLGSAAATPEALQGPHHALIRQVLQEPGNCLLVENTSELSWPETEERRAGLEPFWPGKATSQGVLLHLLVAAGWPFSR